MQDADSNKDIPESDNSSNDFFQWEEQKGTANEAYYINEEGLLTFTAKFLLSRGFCCGNGCRHCPYNYEAVPEPTRSYLLNKRNNTGSTNI